MTGKILTIILAILVCVSVGSFLVLIPLERNRANFSIHNPNSSSVDVLMPTSLQIGLASLGVLTLFLSLILFIIILWWNSRNS